MSLQLHQPDGKGGLERRPVRPPDWRRSLLSPRWGSALKNGRLPDLPNKEMNPTSTAMAVAFWLGLAFLTFVVLVLGYGSGFWDVPPPRP
jgi:hypothetical protein